ncbi:MAG: rhomboid family intramembrane serine protease [Candidatus Cyclobacteriaceae bacterium M3_2C_046]
MNFYKNEPLIFRQSVYYTLSFILILWMIKAIEWAMMMDLGFLGVYPRTFYGTIGIITGPLIHGNIFHLISNTFPLILLGIGVFYFYNKIALEIFLWIYFLTGFWVWVMAREAYHIGASGLVYGLVAFLFFSGLFRKDFRSITISLIIMFLYGGMIYGLIPSNGGISWESHLMGSVSGIICAFYYRKIPLFKDTEINQFSWENEDEEEEQIERPDIPSFKTFSCTDQTFEKKKYSYKYVPKKNS